MKNISISLVLLFAIFSNYAAQKALKRSYVEAFEPQLLISPSSTNTESVDFFELQRNHIPSPCGQQTMSELQQLILGKSSELVLENAGLASPTSVQETSSINVTPLSEHGPSLDFTQITPQGQIDEAVNVTLHNFVGRFCTGGVKDKNDEIAAAWIIALETEDIALIKKVFVNYFQRYYIDVNYQNASGKTALILAAQKGDFDFIIALTLCEGAFLNLRDHEGKNAQFYALTNQRNDIAQFLITLEQSYKQMIS